MTTQEDADRLGIKTPDQFNNGWFVAACIVIGAVILILSAIGIRK